MTSNVFVFYLNFGVEIFLTKIFLTIIADLLDICKIKIIMIDLKPL